MQYVTCIEHFHWRGGHWHLTAKWLDYINFVLEHYLDRPIFSVQQCNIDTLYSIKYIRIMSDVLDDYNYYACNMFAHACMQVHMNLMERNVVLPTCVSTCVHACEHTHDLDRMQVAWLFLPEIAAMVSDNVVMFTIPHHEYLLLNHRKIIAWKWENNTHKGSFTIIDIYESVHSVRFLMTPSPLPKSVLSNVDFFKVIFINSNMHHLHHALIVSHLCEHNNKQYYWY